MSHHRRYALPCLLLAFAFGTTTAAAAEPFEAFLQTHCSHCHGPDATEGDLRIDQLSRDFPAGHDSHRWAEVVERVNSGEMPPASELQPTQAEIASFVASLDALIQQGRAARMAARPPVAHYRLSRKEYQNTVYDLLGVRYDPAKPGELNEDSLWHGYERIGSELSLSPSHIDRYYRAAGIVLDRAFPASTVEAKKVRKTAVELRYGDGKQQQAMLDRLGIQRPLRYLLFPGMFGRDALSPYWFGQPSRAQSGLYKMRLQASGVRPPGGQPAHLRIGPIEFDVTAAEDDPQIYEAEAFLEMPTHLGFKVVATDEIDGRRGGAFRYQLQDRPAYIFTHSSETLPLNPNAPQMFDEDGNGIFSTVIVDWIEWEGPVVSAAEKARRDGVQPPADAPLEVVAEHLQRFAERAWRRPVTRDELQDYLAAYQAQREAGATTAEAYRTLLEGVLTSRHFLYLVEGDPTPREFLTPWELASRLSYFLWSSMPDDDLFAAAGSGQLEGAAAGAQIDRMLADSRSDRFLADFTRQWLQLHRVGMFPPDKNLYPSYDTWLEASMRSEPVEFFRELFHQNLPIDAFIESDWTMANVRLCNFYGLPEPKTDGFHRVALKPEHHRGGLLTMGAVLGLTSDGTRHRPVHRGVWVSEVMFNKTPPPPPANVPAIEPNPPDDPKATLRAKLEAHRNNAACAACHEKIDPLGLAWDNYDAIGQWRTRERVAKGTGDNPPVNPAGVLPDGRAFENPRQFKQLLLADRDTIAHRFIEHLCTYALRRVLTIDDRDDVAAIVAVAKQNDYRLKDIVRAVAVSELIRRR